MPPAVGAAAVTAGAGILGGAMTLKGQREAGYRQWQATQQAAEAERQQREEEKRRYQERWEDYQRRYREWDERRREAQGGQPTLTHNPAQPPNPGQGPQQGVVPTYGMGVPTYGVNPMSGQPRTLGEIATRWNDWSQYGVS